MAEGDGDEEKWLAEGIAGIKQCAFYLRRSMDSNSLRDALKYSAQMLSELRTSKLSPHNYYQLYMLAFHELGNLEMFFKDETRHGCSVFDLYELVQHAGNILPRLYLLCTVGSICIGSEDATTKDILKDLVEMCRCIQNPLRGLFLRSYLIIATRDKLTDFCSGHYDDGAATINDVIEFLLQNFAEMNRLWIRMQNQGHPRNRDKREKERKELRDLVGKNLHVLSQIEGIDLEIYRETVLPRLLEQVVNCNDEVAQNYLMDCIIQVFPDDYHLQTLETLLTICPQLQKTVDMKAILSQLMGRLSNYAASDPEVLPVFLQVQAFSKLSNSITRVIESQFEMPVVGAISLYVSLLTFTLHVHPDRLDYIDQVLGFCEKLLSNKAKLESRDATKHVVALLSAPLKKFDDVIITLSLTNYPRIMYHLDYGTSRTMAMVIIRSVLKNGTHLYLAEQVEALFELIKCLIDGADEAGSDEVDDGDRFIDEQNSLASLIHMLWSDDPLEMLKILTTVRNCIIGGGQKCLPFTLPPLVFSTLKLVRILRRRSGNDKAGESVSQKMVFPLLNQMIEALSDIPAPELALKLYLQCAEAANDCDLEPPAYDFFTRAFVLYEEEIVDSRSQVTAIHLIIGSLQRMKVFGVENRDALTHKTTGCSARLLRKSDQCRAVYACAHLFWVDDPNGIRDGERVLLCLKRSLRIANAARLIVTATRGSGGSGGSATLFIEILNKYAYFWDKENPQISKEAIQGLIELISEEEVQGQVSDGFLQTTLRYIDFSKHKNPPQIIPH